MRLRQEEYCHNCNKYVIFEFDDETYRQEINCPNCGHPHYRELDSGTLLNIRMNPQMRNVRIAKCKPMEIGKMITSDDVPLCMEIEYEDRRILASSDAGIVIEAKDGEKGDTKVISQRRWASSNG